jgi:hypothetical protein
MRIIRNAPDFGAFFLYIHKMSGERFERTDITVGRTSKD